MSVDDPETVSIVTQSRNTKKRAASVNEKGAANTPLELELKDGNYVAYRLKKDIRDLVNEDADEEMLDGDQMAWNVVVPTFQDDEEEENDVAQEDEDEDMDIPIPIPSNNIAR